MELNLNIRNPLFIVFEGIDGSGKTTVSNMTVEFLKNYGIDVEHFAEPSQGVTGRKIRNLLKSPIAPDPDVMLGLFLEDREEDVSLRITPSLESGKTVILDRYYFSNAAYQGASGLSYKRILKANTDRKFPRPDRVYLLDLHPSESLLRVETRNEEDGGPREMFEKESFLSEVSKIYHLI
ncbi:MAG TPA: dTMP kinase, partial [Spirochaetota bacterium]|nr:dTMP kinase [Spirochaetota bacterium]